LSSSIYVSPRKIGFLATEKGCPRCCWWLNLLKNPPFVMKSMPALMYAADAMEKALFRSFIESGEIPDCFSPFTNLVADIKFGTYRQFRAFHPKGLWLHGEPDVLGERADGTLCILDHKSAFYKGDADPFMPQYRCQCIGYCWIAEQLYGKRASGAALIYWQADKTSVVENAKKHWKNGQLIVPFSPKVHEFDLDLAYLDPLIDEYLKIVESPTPPAGRDKCVDCAALEYLLQLNEELATNDAELRRKYPHDRYVKGLLNYHDQLRYKARYSGRALLRDDTFPTFDPEGMWAGFEYGSCPNN
jgi:hypothetical protein